MFVFKWASNYICLIVFNTNRRGKYYACGYQKTFIRELISCSIDNITRIRINRIHKNTLDVYLPDTPYDAM